MRSAGDAYMCYNYILLNYRKAMKTSALGRNYLNKM